MTSSAIYDDNRKEEHKYFLKALSSILWFAYLLATYDNFAHELFPVNLLTINCVPLP